MYLKKVFFRVKVHFIFSSFALIYCLISIVNHAQYRTYALDLGMFNHALHLWANFKPAVFTLGIVENEIPFLGTHFSPIMILYVPFYYIFGTYTLIVIQIFAILFGGLAVYKYSLLYFDKNSLIIKMILIHFFSIWGIYSALSFDFHNNVVASMTVLWFVYFLEKRKIVYSIFFFTVILLSQENMAIWIIFILIGLMIKNRNQYQDKFICMEIPLLIVAIIYSVAIIGYVMPLLQDANHNLHFYRYSHLGSSFGKIISNIITNPLDVISLLYKNILGNPVYEGIKTEFHFMFLISGGIILLFRPVYLVMLIPIFAQKFLALDYNFWGINLHYSIEIVPIISLALIDFLGKIKKYSLVVIVIITILTIYFNVDKMKERKSKWYSAENTVFFMKIHYNPNLNLKEIKQGLKLIDKEENISVSSSLAPHLASRDKIYHFPIIKDSKYIALIKNNRTTYPISKEEYLTKIENLRASGQFEIIYEIDDLIIFKKRNIINQ